MRVLLALILSGGLALLIWPKPARSQLERRPPAGLLGAQEKVDEDIKALLGPIRQKHDLPALAGCIVTREGTLGLSAVGVRKYGDPTPVRATDQFHLGSDTKAMTAVLIGMLVDEKKLLWNEPLAKIFPTLVSRMRPEYRTVTVEQLLAHRSGFSSDSWPQGMNFTQVHQLPGTPRQQRKAYIEKILVEAPVNTPGSTYLYSNRNYALLGVVAEDVFNTDWETLMRQRIFGPLGMTSGGFGAMGSPGRIDEPWQHVMNNGQRTPIAPGPMSDNPPAIAPAGTAHCSIGDWAKLIRVNLELPRREILPQQPVIRAVAPRLVSDDTMRKLHTGLLGGDYGGGWIVTQRDWGGTVLTHAGSNNQNYCVAWVAPEKGFAVLAMTNQGGDEASKACDDVAGALIGYYQQHKPK